MSFRPQTTRLGPMGGEVLTEAGGAQRGTDWGRSRVDECGVGRRWWALGCPAGVAVMQAADFGNLHDRADRRQLDSPDVGSILVEGQMRTSLMIVVEVAVQDAA